MPLYRFVCDGCQTDFEELLRHPPQAEDPLVCPQCESRQTHQVLGLPSVGQARSTPATNCRGDGPPCGLPQCGRQRR